ncbi:helix-turn-helix transcriptional regulator [Ideonella azotifigens]|uniref:OmpR/PhoB-type domain-containing protein n=3 Tax=Ideonella azotifigens TaxID=513160 RepID=A0ABN1K6U1_9BURK|nr:winged helix-turn-helix domain-containing protein [Ideonella azotifigens]MCD2342150.1 helix-turn-helix transcriptional regulator [Ideonella azotifigens]
MNSRSDPEVSAPPTCLRFDDFELWPAERQLLRQGEPVALTARAFGVLVALVERAGQLVSKDELMQRVWAGLIVEDNNIAVHVAQLRKALGPRAIATIAGCGYRFALPVQAGALAAPKLPATRPPSDELPGNLPARPAPLIGREAELLDLLALLATQPLVTVCGEAGVGKTHLAMTAAVQRQPQQRDGAWWVDLAPLSDPAQLAPTIARTLGFKPAEGEDPLAALARRLRPVQMLLVLDNAEHLAEAVSALAAALVAATRALSLLVTSQVPLRAPSEQLFRLAPLALPPEGCSAAQARSSGAMQLLAARAGSAGRPLAWTHSHDSAASDAEVQLAAQVCRELDGNALAIELAAARLPALGLAGLAGRLHQRLGLLGPGTATPRSRRNALDAALDWSHGLLSETEQQVFRRLAVFPGAFELDTAALCLADAQLPPERVVEAILDLVDRSLVGLDRAHAARYRLLETTRLYAQARLAADPQADEARRGFARGLSQVLAVAYDAHWGDPPKAWRERWLPEIDNLRAALDEATAHDAETAAALFANAWPLWEALSLLSEGRQRSEQLLPLLDGTWPAALRARFWESVVHCHTVEYPQRTREAATKAAALYRQLGDTRGEYLACVDLAFNWRVDHPEARAALARAKALEQPAWPARLQARRRITEATLATDSGDFALARELFASVVALRERDGDVGDALTRAVANLADLERAAGRLDEAVRLANQFLPRLRARQPSLDDFNLLGNLLGVLLAQGNVARAREVVAECQQRMRHFAEDSCMWCTLDAFALLHALDGRTRIAAQLAGAADRAYHDHGQDKRQPNEAADRARLDRVLATQAGETQLSAWRAEGWAMATGDALQLAFTGAD